MVSEFERIGNLNHDSVMIHQRDKSTPMVHTVNAHSTAIMTSNASKYSTSNITSQVLRGLTLSSVLLSSPQSLTSNKHLEQPKQAGRKKETTLHANQNIKLN